MSWLRVRFHVGIEECEEDYRPVHWPPVGPYWCTGENDIDFILVAYVKVISQIHEFWPEATNLDVEERDTIVYSDRFKKPDWFDQ